MILITCTKTGRFWRFATEGQARRAVAHLGLKDYIMQRVDAPGKEDQTK